MNANINKYEMNFQYWQLSISIQFSFDAVLSGEQQLKQFSKFLQNHQNRLNNLICKSPVITNDLCDRTAYPLLIPAAKDTLHLQPGSSIGINTSFAQESISTIELIQSDNKCLNKTIAVFVQLCMEVRELCDEGNPLLTKCLFANEEICDRLQNDAEIPEQNDSIQIDEVPLSANLIAKMNSQLATLFQAQQFMDRCFIVISEIIRQFSALFDVDTSGYINVDYSSLHFQVSVNWCVFVSELIVEIAFVLYVDGVQLFGRIDRFDYQIWQHFPRQSASSNLATVY